MTITIEEAKQRLPISRLMKEIGVVQDCIPDRDGKTVRCPWPQNHAHGDRNPSFNTYKGGTRAKCFACAVDLDGPDFVSLWLGLSKVEGFARFMEMAGSTPQYQRTATSADKPSVMTLPDDLRRGGDREDGIIARMRRISKAAPSLARAMAVLRFGTVCGFPSWLLTDGSHKLAEARRMDGKLFPAVGTLGERKAHTLKGSCKSWPVGAALLERKMSNWRAIMLVEGTPDYLAALHFCIERDIWDVLPIAMLGRQTGRGQIHPDALALLKGQRVRIYPHADKDGGGMEAASTWAAQLAAIGCVVDAFTFDGLTKRDGSLVNDLNDTALIHPDQQHELESILP